MPIFSPLLRQYPFARLLHTIRPNDLFQWLRRHIDVIRGLGVTEGMDDLEKRKLKIFNQLSFFQLLTGLLIPFIGFLNNPKLSGSAWLLSSLPALTTVIVLLLNANKKYEWAQLSYFILYPLFICIVYLNRVDLGIELFFILCGILAVFFLREIGQIVFAISFSMISYFVLFLIRNHNANPPLPVDSFVYITNQVLTIGYIFYALFLVTKENTSYEANLLQTNQILYDKNIEIEKQQEMIENKATMLEKQTLRLRQNDKVKSKLFSIISHDLKAPLFALRTLFQQFSAKGMTHEEMEELTPSILNDLNYSTVLVENLLEWAKSQMQHDTIRPRPIDLKKLVEEAAQLLKTQCRNKNIRLIVIADLPVIAHADIDMIRLVLRNLLSNAIKFTPEKGQIIIGVSEFVSCAELYVRDSGKGISPEELKKINKKVFYSTPGTKNESGTGLGLMLCKEFLEKNESRLMIESEPGRGSTFSFTLPAA
jgi:two-component system sensor histidine kinase/response regulator